MASTTGAAVQPAIWIGFLGGWTLSGLVVASSDTAALGATVAFIVGFIGVGAVVFDRRQRMISWSDQEAVPGPWDGQAWEGWLMLAGRVIAILLAVRLFVALPSPDWTQVFWRINS